VDVEMRVREQAGPPFDEQPRIREIDDVELMTRTRADAAKRFGEAR
jgi:hypothetical protein